MDKPEDWGLLDAMSRVVEQVKMMHEDAFIKDMEEMAAVKLDGIDQELGMICGEWRGVITGYIISQTIPTKVVGRTFEEEARR